MYHLADCYLQGIGLEPDAAEAVKWFRKAAELGDVSSMLALISCYKNGIGVEKNQAEAEKWRRKAQNWELE
jgi:hypothetical protein